MYFKAAYWLARRLVHALYRVRLGFADDTSLTNLEERSGVVFLMNHRSNMDDILATSLAAERTALWYAVGEQARVQPLQQPIPAMGGYFVRRESGANRVAAVLREPDRSPDVGDRGRLLGHDAYRRICARLLTAIAALA